jgi:hypothetical protein
MRISSCIQHSNVIYLYAVAVFRGMQNAIATNIPACGGIQNPNTTDSRRRSFRGRTTQVEFDVNQSVCNGVRTEFPRRSSTVPNQSLKRTETELAVQRLKIFSVRFAQR